MSHLEKLTTLLTKDLKNILSKELYNENRVSMYEVGEYWVAFQRSAYLLERMTNKKADHVVLHLENYPFPVIMHNVHYNRVNAMCRKHIMAKQEMEYLEFATHPIDESSYTKWYNKLLKEDNELT